MAYATRLTHDPGSVRREEFERARAAGWSDRELLDAVQVVAYFNFVNRMASGLGVELE